MFVSLQFRLELKREDKEKLMKLMRKQSSARRCQLLVFIDWTGQWLTRGSLGMLSIKPSIDG
jgi:hypothetical protein